SSAQLELAREIAELALGPSGCEGRQERRAIRNDPRAQAMPAGAYRDRSRARRPRWGRIAGLFKLGLLNTRRHVLSMRRRENIAFKQLSCHQIVSRNADEEPGRAPTDELGRRVEEDGTLLLAMPRCHADQDREPLRTRETSEDCRDEIRAVGLAAADERSKDDRANRAQRCRLREMLQHAIDPIATLAHVLEKQYLSRSALQRRAEHRLQHSQVAAEHAARDDARLASGRIERREGRELHAALAAEKHPA